MRDLSRWLSFGLTLLGLEACLGLSGSGLRPPCEHPAPLLGKPDPAAPGYLVVFHEGVQARAETDRVAARYGFRPIHVYEHALRGFSADLTPAVVANLRCEANVRYIEYNATVSASPSPI